MNRSQIAEIICTYGSWLLVLSYDVMKSTILTLLSGDIEIDLWITSDDVCKLY